MKKYFSKYVILATISTLFVAALVYGLLGPLKFSGEAAKIFVPFFSTFFGASFAFFLNSTKDDRKKNDDRISALRVALFTLAKQQDSLGQAWRTLRKWQHRPDKMINMRPISLPDSTGLRQDLSALSFMIPTAPMLLLELTLEDERFAQTVFAIARHAEFHVAEVQPALDKSSLYRRTSSAAAIEKAIGGRIFGTASANADEIFAHLIPTRRSLAEMMPRMFGFAKSIYPNEKFLQITIPDEPEEPAPSLSLDFAPPHSAKEITLMLILRRL